MGWSQLGTQFCFELAFGVLCAMAFVPKAPVGAFFYRIMGTSALVPILIGCIMPPTTGEGSWSDPPVVAGLVAAAAYPVYAGPVRGRLWAAGLGVGLVACALTVAFSIHGAGTVEPGLGLLLTTASALATGLVAGSVGLAMVLGHWYLTIPNLAIRHLQRLNRVTIAAMVLSAVLLGVVTWAFAPILGHRDDPLFGATGLFYLGTRVLVGLVLPLVFAAMTAGSLRYQNTRSATGILYASTVLVLIGTAISVALQDNYGVPL